MVEVISDKRQVFNQIDDGQGNQDSSSPLGKYSNDSDDDNEVYNVDEIMTQVKDQFEDGQVARTLVLLANIAKIVMKYIM